MDLDIGDKVFYTRSNVLRVLAKVVGRSDEGYVELEYYQDRARVVNHHCPMDALSFGIPSWDSTPPSPSSPPADRIPGDASGGSPSRDSSPLRTSSPSPSCSHAVDMLGNIMWICPLAPGTSADVLIWDGYGPSHTRGSFFDFEVGGHDGAYKGWIHVIVPFIGRKNGTLIAPANNVTMTCTGRIGHALSSRLLGCGIGVWLGTSGVAAPMRHFVAFYALLHFQASPSPPLWTMGAYCASCLDRRKQLGRHAR